MEYSENWLVAIRDVLAIIAILIALIKVFISRKSFFSDHERSRRENAIQMIKFWSTNLTKKSSLGRKIVDSLNEEQCRQLNSENELKIDKYYASLLKAYFGVEEIDLNSKDDTIKLNQGQTSLLRWEVVSYLNKLETVLSSWRHNVADKKIIKEEFDYLYNPKDGHELLKNFRKAVGDESFPAIKEFVDALKSNENNYDEGKKAIK